MGSVSTSIRVVRFTLYILGGNEWVRFPRHSVSGSTLLGLTWDSWCGKSRDASALSKTYCRGTSKCLQSCWVWRSLSWCLESVRTRRGIMGFTKFGDKRINDLDLLQGYVVGVACLHREIPCRRICIHLAFRTS